MKRFGAVWMLMLAMAVSGMAFAGTTPAAQQGRQYGNGYNDLQIVSARYGAGNRTMDVTNRVRAQVRNGQIELQVTGDTMGGDPARGTPKILTIQYSFNGRLREVSVNEGDFLRLPGRNDNRSDVLQITSARYGTGNRMMDVTNRLAAQVHNGQIELQVTGDTMGGDPARGTPKILIVQYSINGRPQEVRVNEGRFLKLPGSRYDDRDNDLQITSARYGAGNRMMDVTSRLAAQMRNGQIELQVTGDTMGGDPARGTPKILTVQYFLNGRQQEVRVNEGDFLRLPGGRNDDRFADRPDVLQITSARYGAGNRAMDVTNRLAAQVRNGQIELQVTGDTMGGDPARGTPKILIVQYSLNGRPQEVRVNEGNVLRLPDNGPVNGPDNRGDNRSDQYPSRERGR